MHNNRAFNWYSSEIIYKFVVNWIFYINIDITDSEDEPKIEPKVTPKETKKQPRVIEVVENTHNTPRKSSLLTVTNKPVRKRSVTIVPPAGIKEEETTSSDGGNIFNINSHHVTKRFPHVDRHFHKSYGGFWMSMDPQ